MAAIYMRQAVQADIPAIMTIIEGAIEQLKQAGSPQWQDGYPNADVLAQDLVNESLHVLIVDGKIAGTVSLVVGVEPTYAVIDGAGWRKPDAPYATIHRIAISRDYAGLHLGKLFISNIISHAYAHGVHNLRIDTYKLNQAMQHVATGSGFDYRGVVYMDNGASGEHRDRLAYELNL